MSRKYAGRSKRSRQLEARTSNEIELDEQREQNRKQRLLNELKRLRRIRRARARRWRILRQKRWKRRKRALKHVTLARKQRKKMERELMERQMSIRDIMRERRMRRQIRAQYMLRERRESQEKERQQKEMEEKALRDKLNALKKVELEYDRMQQRSHLSAALDKLGEKLAEKKLENRRVSIKGLKGNHFVIMRRLRRQQKEEKRKINEIIEKLKEIARKRERYNVGQDTLESTKRESMLTRELKMHLLKLDDEEEMEKQVTVQISKAQAAMSSKPSKRRFTNKKDGKRKSNIRGTIITTEEEEQRKSVAIAAKSGKKRRKMSQTKTKDEEARGSTTARKSKQLKYENSVKNKKLQKLHQIDSAINETLLKSSEFSLAELPLALDSILPPTEPVEETKHTPPTSINSEVVSIASVSLPLASDTHQEPNTEEQPNVARTSSRIEQNVQDPTRKLNAKQQKLLAKRRKIKEDRLSLEAKAVEEKLSYWEKMQRKSTVERLRREEARNEFREERIDKYRKMRNKILDTLDKSKHELIEAVNSDKMLRILKPEISEPYRYSMNVEDGGSKRESYWAKYLDLKRQKPKEKITFNKRKDSLPPAQYYERPSLLPPGEGEARKSKFINIKELLGEVERFKLKRLQRTQERVSQMMSSREREEEDERKSTARQQGKKKAEIESDVIMAEKLKKKEEEIKKLVGSEFILPEEDSNVSQTETKQTKEHNEDDEVKELGSIENVISSMRKKKRKRRKRLRPLTSQEKLIKFRYINANCCIVNGKRLDLRKCRESNKKIACLDPPVSLPKNMIRPINFLPYLPA